MPKQNPRNPYTISGAIFLEKWLEAVEKNGGKSAGQMEEFIAALQIACNADPNNEGFSKVIVQKDVKSKMDYYRREYNLDIPIPAYERKSSTSARAEQKKAFIKRFRELGIGEYKKK